MESDKIDPSNPHGIAPPVRNIEDMFHNNLAGQVDRNTAAIKAILEMLFERNQSEHMRRDRQRVLDILEGKVEVGK